MHRQISRQEGAERLTKIHRKLRWIAVLVPLALLVIVAADGLNTTDISIVAFVTIILWLFAFLAGFAADALARPKPQQD